jgi:hypothetical protein
VEIALDLLGHAVIGTATDGRTARIELAPMSVAAFHARFIELLRALGADPEFHGRPSELPDPVPFAKDDTVRPYDAEAVTRFFHAGVAVDRVLKQFRTSFLGKVSPCTSSGQLRSRRHALLRPDRAAASRRHSGPAGRGHLRGL